MYTITRQKALAVVANDFTSYYLSGDSSWENKRLFESLFGDELVDLAVAKGLEEASKILNEEEY